jgi:hypothetical protein
MSRRALSLRELRERHTEKLILTGEARRLVITSVPRTHRWQFVCGTCVINWAKIVRLGLHPAFRRGRPQAPLCQESATSEEISSPHQVSRNSRYVYEMRGSLGAVIGHAAGNASPAGEGTGPAAAELGHGRRRPGPCPRRGENDGARGARHVARRYGGGGRRGPDAVAIREAGHGDAPRRGRRRPVLVVVRDGALPRGRPESRAK